MENVYIFVNPVALIILNKNYSYVPFLSQLYFFFFGNTLASTILGMFSKVMCYEFFFTGTGLEEMQLENYFSASVM